jgi:hypothetical protein
MTMANENAIREWVEALRSGSYKQGSGKLKKVEGDEYRYCCLGIACEIYQRHNGELDKMVASPSDSQPEHIVYEDDTGEHADFMPEVVSKWFELDSTKVPVHVDLTIYDVHYDEDEISYWGDQPFVLKSLDELNDSGLDFDTIATIIEENYLT